MNRLALLTFLCLNFANAIEKLRGVAPKDIPKYQPDDNGNWHCLSDPSIVIPYEYVNDDYCDCPDGSDEPGTSACGNGVFYCANIGFRSNFIPTYKIDDGICDYDVCCDGSDELTGICENRCKELNAKFEEDVKTHNERIMKGLQMKDSILQKSVEIRENLQTSIASLKSNIEVTNLRIKTLEEEKKKLDQKQQLVDEKFEAINNKLDNFTSLLQSKLDGLFIYVKQLESLDQILRRMTNEYNHNFNDPAVKAAANEYLNFAASNEDVASNEGNINTVMNTFNTATDNIKKEIEITKKEIVSLIKNHQIEKEHPTIITKIITFLETLCTQLVESFFGVKSRYDTNTTTAFSAMSVTQLSDELSLLNKELGKMTNELQSAQTELTRDYGENDILRSLTDCIETYIGEYKYKLCLHSTFEQINKDNIATKIGVFEYIKYSELTKNYQLRFNRGERCWNGPVREATVDFVCGTEQKILQVTEPERCIYNIKFETPAGCFESDLISNTNY